MNKYKTYFLFFSIISLLISCRPDLPRQEEIQFVNGTITIVTKSIRGILETSAFGMVDVLWDSKGYIILAGNFLKNAAYDCPDKSSSQISSSTTSFCSFVAKFHGGKIQWVFVRDYYNFAVSLDRENNIVMATENALLKLSTTGQILWEKSLVKSTIFHIIHDFENNIFALGHYMKNAKVGNFSLSRHDGLPDLYYTFLMKLNNNGEPVWTETTMDKMLMPIGNGIAVDQKGNMIIITSENDPLSEKYYTCDPNYNIIVKFDKNKNFVWKLNIDTLANKLIPNYCNAKDDRNNNLYKIISVPDTPVTI